MTFEEADILCTRITDFLLSCGGAYKELTGELQVNVMYALGSGQYIMKEEAGQIVYFVSYWKIRPEDVEGVMERVKPLYLSTGSVMYVTEAGNKAGKRGMAEMIRRLRDQAEGMQGLFWHRPAKQDQVKYFPSQRGKESHHGE